LSAAQARQAWRESYGLPPTTTAATATASNTIPGFGAPSNPIPGRSKSAKVAFAPTPTEDIGFYAPATNNALNQATVSAAVAMASAATANTAVGMMGMGDLTDQQAYPLDPELMAAVAAATAATAIQMPTRSSRHQAIKMPQALSTMEPNAVTAAAAAAAAINATGMTAAYMPTVASPKRRAPAVEMNDDDSPWRSDPNVKPPYSYANMIIQVGWHWWFLIIFHNTFSIPL